MSEMNSTTRYPAPANERIPEHMRHMIQSRPLPIGDYVRSREGQVWTPADTEEIMRVFRQVDRLATELVEKARSER